MYRATPGAGLDYASILDAGQEFSFTAGGITVNGTPTPIADRHRRRRPERVYRGSAADHGRQRRRQRERSGLVCAARQRGRHPVPLRGDLRRLRAERRRRYASRPIAARRAGATARATSPCSTRMRPRASSRSRARPSGWSRRATAARSTSARCRAAATSTSTWDISVPAGYGAGPGLDLRSRARIHAERRGPGHRQAGRRPGAGVGRYRGQHLHVPLLDQRANSRPTARPPAIRRRRRTR